MKRFTMALLMLLLCCGALFARADGADQLRGYDKSAKKKEQYQYVYMGEYPYEKDGTVKPVLWRVLDVSDGQALLLTEYVIDTSQVIFNDDMNNIKGKTHNYRWIDTYDESDLYVYLNTEMMDRLFGDSSLRNAFLFEPGGGKLFILNEEQMETAAYGFSKAPLGKHPDRQAYGTPWAHENRNLYKDHGTRTTTYWVSTLKNGSKDYKMKIVGYDGHISVGALTRINIGVRLAVRLDAASIRITGGNGKLDTPFTLACDLTAPVDPREVNGEVNEMRIEASAIPTEPPIETAVPTQEPTVAPTPAPTQEPQPTQAPKAAAEMAEPETELAALPAAQPAETEAPLQQTASADGDTALLSFIGDCSIGDGYNSIKGERSYHSVVDREGYAWPFSDVVQYLSRDDLTVANLEVVITEKSNRQNIMYPLRAAPDHVNILLEGSVEMVNTVNNHSMDYFDAGYQDTLQYLDEAGIAHFGSLRYNKEDGYDHLAVRDVKGIRFGFVGFSYPSLDSDWAINNIIKRVQKLKEEDGCEIVVVSLHWGRETYMTPESWQLKTAKKILDGGADMIYGHHPHVLQTMCFYKGKPILFSVGNFTFGTMSDVDKRTGIFQTTYERIDGKPVLRKLQVIPCQTRGSNDYRPFEVTGEKDRQNVYKALVAKKKYAQCDNPPDYFLQTGEVLFDENGQLIQ